MNWLPRPSARPAVPSPKRPPPKWRHVKAATGDADLAREKAWLVNEAFLRKQLATGLPVQMTDEGLAWATQNVKSMTARELRFLHKEAELAGDAPTASGRWTKGH